LLSAVFVASAGLTLVAAEAAEFTTIGTVVATGRDVLVVRIDDHRHRIPFSIEAPTVLPAGIAVGSRVSVVYHPTGAVGQAADSVTLLSSPAPKPHRATRGPAKEAPAQPTS
jgi:hypothetical protein